MEYEQNIKRISGEKQATHMGKHRRYTLKRFRGEFGRRFGSTIDLRMNMMYDLLFDMRKDLERKGLI